MATHAPEDPLPGDPNWPGVYPKTDPVGSFVRLGNATRRWPTSFIFTPAQITDGVELSGTIRDVQGTGALPPKGSAAVGEVWKPGEGKVATGPGFTPASTRWMPQDYGLDPATMRGTYVLAYRVNEGDKGVVLGGSVVVAEDYDGRPVVDPTDAASIGDITMCAASGLGYRFNMQEGPNEDPMYGPGVTRRQVLLSWLNGHYYQRDPAAVSPGPGGTDNSMVQMASYRYATPVPNLSAAVAQMAADCDVPVAHTLLGNELDTGSPTSWPYWATEARNRAAAIVAGDPAAHLSLPSTVHGSWFLESQRDGLVRNTDLRPYLLAANASRRLVWDFHAYPLQHWYDMRAAMSDITTMLQTEGLGNARLSLSEAPSFTGDIGGAMFYGYHAKETMLLLHVFSWFGGRASDALPIRFSQSIGSDYSGALFNSDYGVPTMGTACLIARARMLHGCWQVRESVMDFGAVGNDLISGVTFRRPDGTGTAEILTPEAGGLAVTLQVRRAGGAPLPGSLTVRYHDAAGGDSAHPAPLVVPLQGDLVTIPAHPAGWPDMLPRWVELPADVTVHGARVGGEPVNFEGWAPASPSAVSAFLGGQLAYYDHSTGAGTSGVDGASPTKAARGAVAGANYSLKDDDYGQASAVPRPARSLSDGPLQQVIQLDRARPVSALPYASGVPFQSSSSPRAFTVKAWVDGAWQTVWSYTETDTAPEDWTLVGSFNPQHAPGYQRMLHFKFSPCTWVAQWDPVVTDRLMVEVTDATYGFAPDADWGMGYGWKTPDGDDAGYNLPASLTSWQATGPARPGVRYSVPMSVASPGPGGGQARYYLVFGGGTPPSTPTGFGSSFGTAFGA